MKNLSSRSSIFRKAMLSRAFEKFIKSLLHGAHHIFLPGLELVIQLSKQFYRE